MAPAARTHARTAHRRRAAHHNRAPRHRPLVLIADDDADARAIYGSYLRAMGCTVFTARDGAVAVEKAAALSPDVIVMDLAMPQLDGWEATTQLRASKDTEDIPVLALSALELSKDSAREAGCDSFLAKPCQPDLLWWQIRALLHLNKH